MEHEMIWTDEKEALLKKLWSEGHSGSVIANRIGGGLSPSAIAGKAQRMNLPRRRQGRKIWPQQKNLPQARSPKRSNRGRQQSKAKLPRPAVVAQSEDNSLKMFEIEELHVPLEERKTLDTLTERDCHWPIGNPQAADFHYCNLKRFRNSPYCEFHSRKAFQPRKSSPAQKDKITS